MTSIKVFVLGDRITSKSKDAEDNATLEEVYNVLKEIPDLLHEYKTNDHLFVMACVGSEPKYAFANEAELVNTEDGGDDHIVIETYGLDVTLNNCDSLKGYLEDSGLDKEITMHEISEYQIDGNGIYSFKMEF